MIFYDTILQAQSQIEPIPKELFYGLITVLLGFITWLGNRYVTKLEAKIDKTDTALGKIEDLLILHGEWFKSFGKRLEDLEKTNRRRRQ